MEWQEDAVRYPGLKTRDYPNGMSLYLIEKAAPVDHGIFGLAILESRRWDSYVLYDSRGVQIFSRTIVLEPFRVDRKYLGSAWVRPSRYTSARWGARL